MLIKNDNPTFQCYELNECSLPSWYEQFETITIQSKFLKIPQNVLNYLLDEIVILPKECYLNDDNYNDNDDDDDDELPVPEFQEFSSKIKETIESLNGSIFLKTNWHSPKDSFWITVGQTLKVKDITDAYQLLKASNITKIDLNYYDLPQNQQNNEINFYLIMKKWLEIHPGTEFRCFVRNYNLIGISPRDWPQYHKHIIEQHLDIINDIVSIFNEKIQYKFPLENYCFDVVRDTKDNIILIDFSPFNEKYTDSLAFDWSDLLNLNYFNNNLPEFRYLIDDCGIQPSKRNNYGFPQDIIDVFNCSNSNNLTELLSTRLNDEIITQNMDELKLEK